ncbi:MAG: PqqD family protein [Candidatus Acidiferrales bacterium]
MNCLSVPHIPVRNPRLAWRELDGEILIISPDDSQVHELNATASAIWKHANGTADIDEIAAKLALEYDVAQGVAAADTTELVGVLVAKNLLVAARATETGL